MTVYEIDGFQVIENFGWFIPLRYDMEMEDFVPFLRADGWEVQFQDEAAAINYLMGK